MSLKKQLEVLLKKHKIKPDLILGQHFLIDEKVLDKFSSFANNSDIVLEIGAGTGFLTEKLAAKAKKVIAVEVDERFKPLLEKLPENVEIVWGNIIDEIKNLKFDKIVANPHYRLCEPLMHFLIRNFTPTFLVVPRGFAKKLENNPIFSAFFEINEIEKVPETSFFPVPDTDSVIIEIVKKKKLTNDELIRQELYLRESSKLKNGLREALIKIYAKRGKNLTQRQAQEIIKGFKLEAAVLDMPIKNVSLDIYKKLGKLVEKTMEV
jgi:16S rRNA (adenine1518-N6/adenine1519-N6)-dimethyltransferase